MPFMVSGPVTSELNDDTMCNGVSLSRWVVMLTSAWPVIKNSAENSSPAKNKISCSYMQLRKRQIFEESLYLQFCEKCILSGYNYNDYFSSVKPQIKFQINRKLSKFGQTMK